MRLNSEKCKEMIIDFSRNYSLTSGIQSVTIGEQVLERVEHAKMLGVTLVLVGLQSLKKRRDNICKAYFNRLKRNTHRLNHLIPERRDVHYSIRNANVYTIPVTRTDCYKNSIVPWGLCNWQ